MKRSVALILSALLALTGLTACGGGSGGNAGSAPEDYKATIEAARPDELNSIGMFDVVTGPEDAMYEGLFDPAFGFVEADMEKYAISIGRIITQAYGVVIIKPAEGKQEAVLEQCNNYVEMMQKSCESYLQDQYKIAKDAIVKTMPTGEVVMVMCENQQTVMDAIEAAWKA